MHLDNLLCQIQANHCNLVHDFPSHPIDGGTSILALQCRLELGKSLPFAQPGRRAGGAHAPSARRRLVWFVRALMCRIPLAIVLCAGILGSMSIAVGEPKRHVLDVYGEGYAFAVKEPPGWFADTTIAREFGATVIFYPAARDPHLLDTPVIRILAAKKISEDTGADLKHDLDYYRSRYHNVEFRDS